MQTNLQDISIIIPTLQAEAYLPTLLASLKNQLMPACEIIVIDSASTDRTVAIAQENDCVVHVIPRETFRHGRTRNQAARQAKGEILVFLTQDALPADEHFLGELTRPLREGWAAAANARQVPRPEADPIEKLTRVYNYPEQSKLRSQQDLAQLGVKAVFFSNAASTVKKQIFWQVGGFSELAIVHEDMDLCMRILQAGHQAAYQASALVYHSHRLTALKLFRRYFDTGVFFNQAQSLMEDIPLEKEGKNYISHISYELVVAHKFHWLPVLYFQAGIKLSAYQLGKHWQQIPRWLVPRLSAQPHYWQHIK